MMRRKLLAAGALLCLGVAMPPAGVRAQSLADTDVVKLPAPKNAAVLFDGSKLSKWVNRKDGDPAGWTVRAYPSSHNWLLG